MKPEQDSRNEKQIFADLQALAAEPGYAHAIAALCFRDNTIGFSEEIQADDIAKMFSNERLVRTEVSTLIGLLVKADLNLWLPPPNELQRMLDRSDALLLELHKAMNAPSFKKMVEAVQQQDDTDPLSQGNVLREAIFYSGESAYNFQYRDFAGEKYAADKNWLRANKGFVIHEALTVVRSISNIQNEKIPHTLNALKTKDPSKWTLLPGYMLTLAEVTDAAQLDPQIVTNVLNAFCLPSHDKNECFNSVSDFNSANACPLIRVGDDQFLLFQSYSLVEALYESPFYWMASDPSYSSIAAKNRGLFTERFCADRMQLVFGERRVYQNVSLTRGKKTIVGEIDVLVLFGNRAVIIQAKSKRLTIESRKGNDNQIRDDFKLSIQNSYDQGLSCAKALLEDDVHALDIESCPIKVPLLLKEIYIFCVLSEHYPSLAFQVRQLIKVERSAQIMPPFVMDVFLIDTMTEMLPSPLHFLAYINRRTKYDERVLAGHELTVLSYHLNWSLWIDPKFDMFYLYDDISADLDVAMMARREGLPGQKTPDGILTRLRHTRVGRLIEQIEHTDDAASVDLGFMLLTLGEDTVLELSEAIEAIAAHTRADYSHHDLTIGVDGAHTGITVHCNYDNNEVAMERLGRHCELRKYSQKARTWFGLCLEPRSVGIRFGLTLDFPWQQSNEMGESVASLPKGQEKINLTTYERPQRTKIGRNDPCPCGSGRKYKKCCLNRRK